VYFSLQYNVLFSWLYLCCRSRSRTRTPTPLRNVAKPKNFVTQGDSRPGDKRSRDQPQPDGVQDNRPVRRGPEWPSGKSDF